MTRSTAKARIFKTRSDVTGSDVWIYMLIDSSGMVVGMDNTRLWHTIFEQAFGDVVALRRIENMGHTLTRSFQELVDAEND